MVVVMTAEATVEELDAVVRTVEEAGGLGPWGYVLLYPWFSPLL